MAIIRVMAGTKQFNEDDVLDRAMLLFWRRGFGNTSMQDIAQATGVLRGSLYHAYGDKQALFLRIMERYRTWFLDSMRTALDQPTLEESLRGYLRFSIATITAADEDDVTRGCLTTKTATDETAMDDAIRAALRATLDAVRDLLVERLSRPDAEGRLALPPAGAARLIATATRGLVVLERVYRDRDQLQGVADDLITVLLRDPA
jgi:AcrR family transcriptional regulator